MKMNRTNVLAALTGAFLGGGLASIPTARAHCDTMDGPVVLAAQTALEKKDVTPVLKWVKPEAEAGIKAAFSRTLAVRAQGPEARELADQFFFETLVRVHRAGEGAPFTGLKPAGTETGPAIAGADKALDRGSVEDVIKLVTDEVAAGIRRHFAEVREKQAHADHTVAAGRAFVAAYVEYVHYVEGLHQAAQTGRAHPEGHAGGPAESAQGEPTPAHEH